MNLGGSYTQSYRIERKNRKSSRRAYEGELEPENEKQKFKALQRKRRKKAERLRKHIALKKGGHEDGVDVMC